MTVLAELLVESAEEPWQRLGLDTSLGAARVGGVVLRFVPGTRGIVAWGLSGVPEECHPLVDIDGLTTYEVTSPAVAGEAHAMRVVSFDHVVVNTASLDRTCGAIEAATRAPLKRVREVGAIRQGFHRMGEAVIEVVESPTVQGSTASFWGLVWNVDDLDALCARLGPSVIAPAKDAVQPGRRIATVRAEAGLGVPVALMTPPPPRA